MAGLRHINHTCTEASPIVALGKFCRGAEACVPFAHLLPHEDPVGANLFPGRATVRVCCAKYPVQVLCVRRPLGYSGDRYRWLGGYRKSTCVWLEQKKAYMLEGGGRSGVQDDQQGVNLDMVEEATKSKFAGHMRSWSTTLPKYCCRFAICSKIF